MFNGTYFLYKLYNYMFQAVGRSVNVLNVLIVVVVIITIIIIIIIIIIVSKACI